jgi:hypothetical protein
VTTDPYRVLGVVPTADEAAIRAAYRKLMKRFHPDRNRSAEAVDRAREVAAAYALLSDPEQRGRFDRERRFREQVIAPAPPPPPRRAPRGRLGGFLLVVLSFAITAFALVRFDPALKPRPSEAPPSEQIAAKAGEDVPEMASVVAPAARRQAGAADEAPPLLAAPPPAPAVSVSLPQAALPMPKAATGPLPPSGRTDRPLSANPTTQLPVRIVGVTPSPPPKAETDSCETAATCATINLAALERMQSLLDRQSHEHAPAAKQARLIATRAAFLSRLGRCATAACKRDAYLARTRELAELMRS